MIVVKRILVTVLFFSWSSVGVAATWYDVNGDGKEGLAETIHSLQVVAGLSPSPPPGTFTNVIGMHLRLIPAGTFIMGSPDGRNGDGTDTHHPYWPEEIGRNDDETQHLVTITEPYYMQTTEVTQAQWSALVIDYLGGANPSHFVGANLPVDSVSWYEAASFANWVSYTEGRTSCYTGNGTCSGTLGVDFNCDEVTIVPGCNGYRLPTEAQWEHAARAGTITATYNGDLTVDQNNCDNVDENIDPIAWYCANADNTTHAVGQKEPNRWGLYDMSGNVYEWCETWFEADYPVGPQSDPSGPESGYYRLVRGGGWTNTPRRMRSAYRGLNAPESSATWFGFRLVLEASSVQNL